MPLVFFYMAASPAARAVDLVIHTLGLTAGYKYIDIHKNDHLTPEYLKMNPVHSVPIIDDDGFILWESRAILTYLVSKYGKDDSLYPKDLQKRAIVDQRLHYSNDIYYMLKHLIIAIFNTNLKEVPTEAMIKVQEHQEHIEKLLDGYSYMAGDSLTVADYIFITVMDIFEVLSPMKKRFPLTKAWIRRTTKEIANFDEINEAGADIVITRIKDKLDLLTSTM